MTDPSDNQVSALPLRTAGQVYVRLPDIPPPTILQALGRAVVLFAQLEYQHERSLLEYYLNELSREFLSDKPTVRLRYRESVVVEPNSHA